MRRGGIMEALLRAAATAIRHAPFDCTVWTVYTARIDRHASAAMALQGRPHHLQVGVDRLDRTDLSMKRRIVVSLVFLLAVGLCGGLVWFNFFRDKMIAQFFANMQQPAADRLGRRGRAARPGRPASRRSARARRRTASSSRCEIGGVVKDISFSANQQFKQGRRRWCSSTTPSSGPTSPTRRRP